ncbi:MAG: trigger factor [Rhodospirillaceae bacterium]|nr:trigger factor [Rhodospirillaceae bacterium]
MQVTDQGTDGLKRKLAVVIPASSIEEKVNNRLSEVGQQVRLPGFRPGKVPMTLLKKRFGQAVRGEVLERAIDESTQSALTERAVKPAMQPKIEVVKADEGGDLEFSVEFEVLPEIAAKPFTDLELTRLVATVSDKEHDEAVAGFLKNRRTTEKLDEARAAKKGDGLLVDFVGRIDGKEFDGGSVKDAMIVLGDGQYLPDFEKGLDGIKAGETKTFKLTFPDDYAGKVAGQTAEFEVTAKELHKVTVPELTDDLAKSMGDESAQGMRDRMRKFLQDNYDSAARMRLKRQLLDKLADAYSFDVPQGLVDVEFDAIWRQMERVKADGQLDPEDQGKSDDELKAEYRKIAERRVRLGLLLSDVGQKNNVSVSQDDMNKAVIQEAMRYPGQENAVVEYYQRNPQAMETLRAPLFEDKVVDYILSQAKITDQPASIEDVMKDPEDEAAEKEKPKKKAKSKKKDEE